MASLDSHVLMNFFLISSLLVTAVSSETKCLNFKSIISFGDSIADTGNLIGLSTPNELPESAFPPYGETFFHHPTGRYSDGRLIIDFIGTSSLSIFLYNSVLLSKKNPITDTERELLIVFEANSVFPLFTLFSFVL